MKSEEAKIQQEQQQAPIKYEATRVLPPQSDIIDVLYYYDSILPLDQKLFDQEAVMIASRVAKFRNKCDRLRKNIDHRIAAIVDTMDSENLNRILKQELGALYKHISFNFKGVIEDLKFNHNYDFTFPNKVINYKDFNKVYDNLKYLEKKVNEAIGEGIDHPAAIDKEGMCYGLTSIWLWNKRQEDIGNTTDKGNPTRIMNEVFTKITRKPKNLNNEDRKDVEILINYLLATQNSHYIAKELNLIDIADKIDKKYSRHKKDSDRVTQGLYLVDPSGDIRNPMIQRVFNKDLLKCKLKDLDYILQPGVLLESSTRDHAMGCYMDGDKNIFFYDPNDGKEVKFDDIDELKKYLTSGKMVANYFSDGEFRPRISIVNYGTAQKYKVEKYYSDLEKLLNQNTPNEKLQYNSSEIKDICIQELRESKILYAIKNNKTIEGEDATVYAFDIGLEIEGKNAITYAVDNNIKIRDTDPTVYAFDKGLKIEGRNAIMYAVAKGIQIEKKDPIIYASDKGLIFGSKDPIQFAIDKGLKIKGKNAITYAIDIGLKIEGKNAITYAVDNNIKIRDTDPTVYAFDKGLKIEGRNAIMYAVAKGIQIEKKDPIIYAYDKGLIFGSKDPIQFAIDTNLKIDGINAIRYAVENEITIDGRSAVDYKMERYENSKKAVEDVNKLFAAMEEDDKNKREQLWGKIRREELLEKIRRERLSEEIIIKANSKPQAVDVKDSEAGAFNSFKFNSINLKDFEETNKAAAVLKQSMTESVGPKSTKSSTLLSPDSSPRTFKRSNSKRSSNSV